MLTAPPPQGYDPTAASQQYSQLLGPPNQFAGAQNLVGNPQLASNRPPTQGMPFTVPTNSMDPAHIAMMLMQGRP